MKRSAMYYSNIYANDIDLGYFIITSCHWEFVVVTFINFQNLYKAVFTVLHTIIGILLEQLGWKPGINIFPATNYDVWFSLVMLFYQGIQFWRHYHVDKVDHHTKKVLAHQCFDHHTDILIGSQKHICYCIIVLTYYI